MTDAFGMRREYQDLLQNQPGFAEAVADSLANAPIFGGPNHLLVLSKLFSNRVYLK